MEGHSRLMQLIIEISMGLLRPYREDRQEAGYTQNRGILSYKDRLKRSGPHTGRSSFQSNRIWCLIRNYSIDRDGWTRNYLMHYWWRVALRISHLGIPGSGML